MHASNYGYNGVPSVSRDAKAFHKQRSRFHPGVLGVLAAESRGVAANLGGDTRGQGSRYKSNSNYVGKEAFLALRARDY